VSLSWRDGADDSLWAYNPLNRDDTGDDVCPDNLDVNLADG
jgi:hypothetical protein